MTPATSAPAVNTPAAYGIAVEGVSKRLRQNQALAGISIHFEPGLMHGVIGPEGAGKTTLLRTLAGLLHTDEGSVTYRLDGEVTDFAAVREGLAYMPQQQSLYPDLSVGEHLAFFRDLYSLPKAVFQAKREELLHITRLDKFEDRPAGKLSGGMYKKLGLMCSLLRSPRILLLDEPTNGVDPISRREFWQLLYRLADERILIIVATAYMDEAERCARAHLMQDGKLLASGEPRTLLQSANAGSFDELFIKATDAPHAAEVAHA
ncbi:MAG TPA: ABC transporter ATP-binding protein [bacterium]